MTLRDLVNKLNQLNNEVISFKGDFKYKDEVMRIENELLKVIRYQIEEQLLSIKPSEGSSDFESKQEEYIKINKETKTAYDTVIGEITVFHYPEKK